MIMKVFLVIEVLVAFLTIVVARALDVVLFQAEPRFKVEVAIATNPMRAGIARVFTIVAVVVVAAVAVRHARGTKKGLN